VSWSWCCSRTTIKWREGWKIEPWRSLGFILSLTLWGTVVLPNFGIFIHVETGNCHDKTDTLFNHCKSIFRAIKFFHASENLILFDFSHEERRAKKKNQRHRGTEIVPRSAVKIKTQTTNLQSLVHFMPWHLLEQIWGNRSCDSRIWHFHFALTVYSIYSFSNCLRCRLADAQKISIEKSKYLGGWYCCDIYLFILVNKYVLLVFCVYVFSRILFVCTSIKGCAWSVLLVMNTLLQAANKNEKRKIFTCFWKCLVSVNLPQFQKFFFYFLNGV
jgi:hypothetical protein